MFRNTLPSPLADTDVTVPTIPTEPVPLSVLALDLGEPVTGWASHLADRGVEIVLDDLGRASVARSDARRLFTERREDEARQREIAERQEQQAIERDRAFRAALPTGLHWTDIPVGVSAAELWAQAERDARPKRLSPLQEALSGESLTFHSLQEGES